jgi:hypothetical protein
VQYGKVRYGDLRYGDLRYGKVRYGKVRYGDLRYGKVRYGKVRYGKVRYGEVRYGEVRATLPDIDAAAATPCALNHGSICPIDHVAVIKTQDNGECGCIAVVRLVLFGAEI